MGIPLGKRWRVRARRLLTVAFLLGLPSFALAQPAITPQQQARIDRILQATPLIDGHNDLPWEIRDRYASDLSRIDLDSDLSRLRPPMPDTSLPVADIPGLGTGTVGTQFWTADKPFLMTDIPRLRSGHVGAQFWSVFVPAEEQGAAAAQMVHEQIDLVRRMVARYPRDFELAQTADDIERIYRAGRIASLMGMEGGEPINRNLAVLRDFRAEGVMYMTLCHFKTTSWVDSATDAPRHGGLSEFGEQVVREMNRIGMLVDLSHVSADAMRDALRVTSAPVIFSHSSAFAIRHHPRNVPDDVLRTLHENGGLVMVNFFPVYLSEEAGEWDVFRQAEMARQNTLHPDDPAAAAAAVSAWESDHPRPRVTVAQVADHIDHIRDVAGVDQVGLGSDFDGIPYAPDGLEGVDDFPNLLAELLRRGWSDADLSKLIGGNLLRVMRAAERVATQAAQ